MRLAYADPPYPGKAHLYPENTEVDHIELVARLQEYDGWALSTDEVNLRHVLALCPPKTRVLAWCRKNAVPMGGVPYPAWEPVLCKPARTSGVTMAPSFFLGFAPTGWLQVGEVTGQKTAEFCHWVIRCLGAMPDDKLDDIYPGTGIMGQTFAKFNQQLSLDAYFPVSGSKKTRLRTLRRVAEPLPGIEGPGVIRERRVS